MWPFYRITTLTHTYLNKLKIWNHEVGVFYCTPSSKKITISLESVHWNLIAETLKVGKRSIPFYKNYFHPEPQILSTNNKRISLPLQINVIIVLINKPNVLLWHQDRFYSVPRMQHYFLYNVIHIFYNVFSKEKPLFCNGGEGLQTQHWFQKINRTLIIKASHWEL